MTLYRHNCVCKFLVAKNDAVVSLTSYQQQFEGK